MVQLGGREGGRGARRLSVSSWMSSKNCAAASSWFVSIFPSRRGRIMIDQFRYVYAACPPAAAPFPKDAAWVTRPLARRAHASCSYRLHSFEIRTRSRARHGRSCHLRAARNESCRVCMREASRSSASSSIPSSKAASKISSASILADREGSANAKTA
jgi:hypothetical protein